MGTDGSLMMLTIQAIRLLQWKLFSDSLIWRDVLYFEWFIIEGKDYLKRSRYFRNARLMTFIITIIRI
jgi:hypothetical protein